MIIPSIDLLDSKAVQLKQGKEKVLERTDVLELAKYYARFGEIAVIDLDAATNTGKNNEELIAKICKIAPCRVGGGIRDINKAKKMLALGAKKIIIGTAASEEMLSKLPKDKVIVAIDSKYGNITINGWQEDTDIKTSQYVKRFENCCSGFLYTIVENEGMLKGTNLDAISSIRKITDKPITAAGGISSINEIKELENMNVSSQLGMSIYTGKINLPDAFCALIDFAKCANLVPTVVQDIDTLQVLMLAYSSPESLKQSLETGKATYFSRSRNELWTKGKTSGNFQELIAARFDCDKDTILFKVKQTGNACHLNRFSCFEDKDFCINDLYNLIKDRKYKLPKGSYTTKLFKDEFYLKRKIMEEAFETVNFEFGDGLSWECADLLYHLLVFMAMHDIDIDDIKNNLSSRTK